MFDADLLLAFVVMGALFLRQISIYKEPHKINYAPLMLGIGAISATFHFITHPEATQVLLVLKESLLPILVALILFFIANILHQTQISEEAKREQLFLKLLVQEIGALKELGGAVEKKMILSQQEEQEIQEQLREKFRHDIKILDTILENQNRFLEEFQRLQLSNENVNKSLENFTNVKLPSLDDVVHKHIDIFRVAEQDHFNKVKGTLERMLHTKEGIAKEVTELKEQIQEIGTVAQTIAKTITQQTLQQLGDILRPFEKELLNLKTHSQIITNSLQESQNRAGSIREQSEIIMKQMLLASKKINELQTQNSSLHELYTKMRELLKEIESLDLGYRESQTKLDTLLEEFYKLQKVQTQSNKEEMDLFLATLKSQTHDLIQKLSAQSEDPDTLSSNLKFLSKQAQLKNRYSELEGQKEEHRVE